MKRLRELVKKTWVYATAAALIVGSSSGMALYLGNSTPVKAASNVVVLTDTLKPSAPLMTTNAAAKVNYKLIDKSKTVYDDKEALKKKLSYNKNLTPQQIEEQCNKILASQIPGAKDISPEQAASYSADMLIKAFSADLNGYIAEARFLKSTVPNSDTWTIVFHPDEQPVDKGQKRFTRIYIADVNSVSGKMISVEYSANTFPLTKVNLNDSSWAKKAEQAVSQILPKEVSIKSSKIAASDPQFGVYVVCELSDGTAYAVRMVGENKEVRTFLYFQNGYDGSLEKYGTEPAKG